jgi:DNA mismatch repair protein MSH3
VLTTPANSDLLNLVPALVGLLTEYPKQAIIALAHMVEHLSKFNISRVFRKQTRFKQFMERNHMLLNANTLTNL